MKNYSDWRICRIDEGFAVYRLKNYRKGIRPGNVIIYDVAGTYKEAAELADAINETEHHGE